MKDALTYIVSSIVTDAKTVTVEEHDDNGVVEFIVHVPKEDIGKVIGKDGKVVRAIRNVLKIPAIKAQKKIHITLQEA